jgi:hypothetical protein
MNGKRIRREEIDRRLFSGAIGTGDMERREIKIRCESEFAVIREVRRCVRKKRVQVNASGPSDVCVCVMTKPGLRRRGVQGVTLGWRRPPERCSILWDRSSERARPRPLRCALALKTLWESVRKWSTSPPSSFGAAGLALAASSTNNGVIRGGESSPNM